MHELLAQAANLRQQPNSLIENGAEEEQDRCSIRDSRPAARQSPMYSSGLINGVLGRASSECQPRCFTELIALQDEVGVKGAF
jgi:hypothetical protein